MFAEVLRQALPGWTIYGTDLSDVAVKNAARRYPECRFFPWSEGAQQDTKRQFDLLFTHHVLEHVIDLDMTWERMAQLLKPTAWMLHVLPCGDPGSFEHQLCRLKTDGIEISRGNRFFYEEESHFRRLDTGQLVRAAADHGFELRHSRYANQFRGAVEWITGAGPDFNWQMEVKKLVTLYQRLERPARQSLVNPSAANV